MPKHVSTLLEWTGQTHTGCYEIPFRRKKKPRKPIREATGIYWEWKSTRILSLWKQDQNEEEEGGGGGGEGEDNADNEFKVHVRSIM